MFATLVAGYHQFLLDHTNSIMFTVMVRHQLSGQPAAIPWRAERRNRSAPMSATLARTFAAESQSGARGRHKLAIAAGRRATDPSRQIRPRSPQYSRRWEGGSASAEAPSWTIQVKHGTSIPTVSTSTRPAFDARAASDPEKIAVTAPRRRTTRLSREWNNRGAYRRANLRASAASSVFLKMQVDA